MNSVDLIALLFAWVCIWILCRAGVELLHRRHVAELEARAGLGVVLALAYKFTPAPSGPTRTPLDVLTPTNAGDTRND